MIAFLRQEIEKDEGALIFRQAESGIRLKGIVLPCCALPKGGDVTALRRCFQLLADIENT